MEIGEVEGGFAGELQGLADTFILLGMPFDGPEAKQLNKEIFEAIYFAALETSCQLAQKEGALPFNHVFAPHAVVHPCGPPPKFRCLIL